MLGEGSTVQDKSDRNHLTHAIAENVHAFVTRDGFLLDNADKLYDQFGISVCRPVDFVVNADTASEQLSFDRKDLTSVRLSIVRTQPDDTGGGNLASICRHDEKELKLKAKLRGWLAHPDRFDVISIVDADGTTSGHSCSRETWQLSKCALAENVCWAEGNEKGTHNYTLFSGSIEVSLCTSDDHRGL